jgi:hypothetical protein
MSRSPIAARRRAALVASLALVVLGLSATRASAVILPAVTIAGPSEDVVGFGGVAMAEDGTGGAVWLQRVDGVAHVFVARFQNGQWSPPIRVDGEQPFAASSPRIGAAEGGRLVVVWATPFATENERPVDELLGATLAPGASSFGPAMLIDPDVRDATGLSPDLAMSSSGRADVVYRVIFSNLSAQQAAIPLLRPGDVIEDVRVAHYNGETWSRLGAINRNSGVSMRPPAEANAPALAINQGGNAIVVWQEPDIDGVARIWARRLFGSSLDYVLPVSAASFNSRPIGDDADAPSVAISKLGEAVVAYRQDVSPGSPLPGARILLNKLPDGESESGAQFSGAAIADNTVTGGSGASIGPPSVDLDEKQELRLLYDANGTPRVINGNGFGLSGSLTLGSPFAGADSQAASVMNPSGGGVSAWPSADARGEGVAVREDFPGGAVQTAIVRGGSGGPVAELSVGRSGLGDGLIGFRQGPLGNAAIAVAEATTPPVQLTLNVPRGWIRPSRVAISWQPARSANGPLGYQLVVDGQAMGARSAALAQRLDSRRLGTGRHRVQVLATDINGQAMLSAASTLQTDGSPPTVKASRASGGHGVSVRLGDGGSGLAKRSISISYGDGTTARGRARSRHRYAHGGVFQLVIRARDKLGNQALVRRLVSVR